MRIRETPVDEHHITWPGARLRSMGGADLFEAPWSGCVFAHLEGARPAAGRAPRGPSSPRDDRHPRRSGGSGPVAGDRLRAEGPATRPGLRRAQRRLRPAPQTRNRSLIAALQRALRPITAHYVNVRRAQVLGRGAPERSVFAVSRSPELMRPRGPAGRKTRALRQDRGVEVGEVDSPPRSPRDALRARRPVASAGSPEVDGTSGRVPRESVY